MPSADAHGTWFPEMVVRLRSDWQVANVDVETGPAAEPHVSVRALILAMARFGIASKDQTRALEKAWAEYREQHRLDVEEKPPGGSREVVRMDDQRRDGSFHPHSTDV